LGTTQVPFVRVSDLVTRTFGEFLSHTPLGKLGINRDVHFRVESEEARDRMGHRLAPPDVWGEWAESLTSGKGDKHGGMLSLTMQQSDVDDRPAGYIRAKVEPSDKIKGRVGVYVQVNDHYEIENPDDAQGCDEIIRLLAESFDRSISRSEWIIDQVMRLKDV